MNILHGSLTILTQDSHGYPTILSGITEISYIERSFASESVLSVWYRSGRIILNSAIAVNNSGKIFDPKTKSISINDFNNILISLYENGRIKLPPNLYFYGGV